MTGNRRRQKRVWPYCRATSHKLRSGRGDLPAGGSLHDLGQSDRAVAVGLDYLTASASPGRRTYPRRGAPGIRRLWSQLGGRHIEELIDLPLMHDPRSPGHPRRADCACAACVLTDKQLGFLIACRGAASASSTATPTGPALSINGSAVSPAHASATTKPGIASAGSAVIWLNSAGLKSDSRARTLMSSAPDLCPGQDMSGKVAICCVALSRLPTRAAT